MEVAQAIELRYREAKQAIMCAISRENSPIPIFLWGSYGIGKSSLIQELSAELEFECRDVRLSQLDSVDLLGLPRIVTDAHGNAMTEFCPPAFLPREDKKILIFLDELNQANKAVQAAALQLILDRRVGSYKLPSQVVMVGAGNRLEDMCFVQPLSFALKTRMLHITLVPNLDDWFDWAVRHDIDDTIIGFVKNNPDKFHKMIEGSHAQPCPRTWEFASRMIKGITDSKLVRINVASAVGIGPATEYMAWREVYRLFDVDDIFNGKLPDFMKEKKKGQEDKYSSAKFAMTLAVASATMRNKAVGKEKNLVNFLDNLDKEYVVLFFKNINEEKVKWFLSNPILKSQIKIIDYLYLQDDIKESPKKQ